MTERIILLSGAISSGKSTLGRSLETSESAVVFRTREVIQRSVSPGFSQDRKALQAEGDRLDSETDQRWVFEAFKQWRSGVDRTKTLGNHSGFWSS